MSKASTYQFGFAALVLSLFSLPAMSQSFMVQCPKATLLHPTEADNNTENPYDTAHAAAPIPYAAATQGSATYPYISNGGAIKCQQVSGGDGYMTEADGNQTFLFGFGPLSGISLIQQGLPGTQFPKDFNQPFNPGTLYYQNGQQNPLYGKAGTPDGAVTDPAAIMDTGVLNANIPAPLIAIDEDDELFLTLTNVGMIMRPDLFEQHTIHFHGYPNASSYYDGVPDASLAINIGASFTYYYLAPDAGTYFWHCHITPPEHLQMGMVGQLFVRPRQNRVPVGSGLYAAALLQQKDQRTACLNTGPAATTGPVDILCSVPLPASNSANQVADPKTTLGYKYAYNDGDGTTRYDIDVPIQIHGFDPNFHFVGMTFNPEGFSDMKDKYFLLNGRSYPDTANPAAISTMASDGQVRPSQPLSTLITLNSKGGLGGEKALLRIADLDVTEYQTLATLGLPMQIVGYNAKLLRDQAGNNLYYNTNSITLGGGESLDAMIDSCAVRDPADSTKCKTPVPAGTYFLYTPNLDHLSNDAENFGGLMTEIQVL
jgi:FtsP/CotA-like multicopper oxidase with cupredoxin domain